MNFTSPYFKTSFAPNDATQIVADVGTSLENVVGVAGSQNGQAYNVGGANLVVAASNLRRGSGFRIYGSIAVAPDIATGTLEIHWAGSADYTDSYQLQMSKNGGWRLYKQTSGVLGTPDTWAQAPDVGAEYIIAVAFDGSVRVFIDSPLNGTHTLTLPGDPSWLANTVWGLVWSGSPGQPGETVGRFGGHSLAGGEFVVAELTDFQTEYVNRLITQYWDKDNARSEIALLAQHPERIFDLLNGFGDAFDPDQATGDRLDKIGSIVGLARTSAVALPAALQGATPSQLSDTAYQFLLKVKIAKNNASAFMVSDERISIQEVVQRALDGEAYVLDSLNMALTLVISTALDVDMVAYALDANLLPKPQGVRYRVIVNEATHFGFAIDPNALGFSRKSGGAVGAPFARKVF